MESTIQPPINSETVEGAPASYFIAMNGQKTGPFSEDQIQSMLRGGMLTAADLAWREGMSDWLPLWQVVTLRVPEKDNGRSLQRGKWKNKFLVPFLCIIGALVVFGLGIVVASISRSDEGNNSNSGPTFSYDYGHSAVPSDRAMFRGENSSDGNIPFVSGNSRSSGSWGQYQVGPGSTQQDASAERAEKLKRETDSRYPVCPRCRGVGLEGRGTCPFCKGVGRVPVNR